MRGRMRLLARADRLVRLHDTVLQQFGANHTCAHIGTMLSKAHRGHLDILPATSVLLITLSP